MKTILFNTEMVRAILDGQKTVTRRVVKPQPGYNGIQKQLFRGKIRWRGVGKDWKPPYSPGEILYVKETWAYSKCGMEVFVYRADDTEKPERGWHASTIMPREAARLFLRVTGLRVQRVQDIADVEAWREGYADRADFHRFWNDRYAKPRPVMGEKWEIDHYESYPWEDIQETRTYKGKPWYVIGNPWVWVINFKRINREKAENG